jgi:hypothetical protein
MWSSGNDLGKVLVFVTVISYEPGGLECLLAKFAADRSRNFFARSACRVVRTMVIK